MIRDELLSIKSEPTWMHPGHKPTTRFPRATAGRRGGLARAGGCREGEATRTNKEKARALAPSRGPGACAWRGPVGLLSHGARCLGAAALRRCGLCRGGHHPVPDTQTLPRGPRLLAVHTPFNHALSTVCSGILSLSVCLRALCVRVRARACLRCCDCWLTYVLCVAGIWSLKRRTSRCRHPRPGRTTGGARRHALSPAPLATLSLLCSLPARSLCSLCLSLCR